jgi:Tfp pilus assembly protein PilW
MVKIQNNKGVTILELLIVALMTSIIAAAGMEFFVRVNQQYVSQDDITEMQQNVRASLEEICRELRMAGFNTPDTVAAYSVSDVSGHADSLTVNRDTLSIRYYVDESDTLHPTLMKEVNGNAEIYADEISDFQINVINPGAFQVSITANTTKTDDQIMSGQKLARTLTQVISLRNIN